jgi:hypothetical protein
MLRSKQRIARNKLRRQRLGIKGELPTNVATKDIPPYPRFPPESFSHQGVIWIYFTVALRIDKFVTITGNFHWAFLCESSKSMAKAMNLRWFLWVSLYLSIRKHHQLLNFLFVYRSKFPWISSVSMFLTFLFCWLKLTNFSTLTFPFILSCLTYS